MNRVVKSSSIRGLVIVFALPSNKERLKYEQRWQLTQAGRPCPKVTTKGKSSKSAYETSPWIGGDGEKNSYYCSPCLIMGDLSKGGYINNI